MPTLQSRVFVFLAIVGILKANFTMAPNEQNQHFAELRQTIRISAPNRFAKVVRERFVTKTQREKRLPNSSQTHYSYKIKTGDKLL